MQHQSPWRSESEARLWTQRSKAISANLQIDRSAVDAIARWSLLWDRQICFELVNDSTPETQLATLQTRIDATEEPGKTPFWEHRKLAEMAATRLLQTSDSQSHGPRNALALWLLPLIQAETQHCIADLEQLGKSEFLSKTSLLVQPDLLFYSTDLQRIDADTSTKYWGHWYPGLSNDQDMLCDAIASLPGATEIEIPEVVRRLENPSSPVALPGAVTLRRHDVLHILLGRGLLDQDEAFVVGFTMGNASKYRDADGVVMRQALAQWYPEPFRIFGAKLDTFDLGVQTGKNMGVPDISQIPIEELTSQTVGSAREDLKLSVEQLRRIYAFEKNRNPSSIESGRLST
jgi:hypothetical protein